MVLLRLGLKGNHANKSSHAWGVLQSPIWACLFLKLPFGPFCLVLRNQKGQSDPNFKGSQWEDCWCFRVGMNWKIPLKP